MSEEVLSPEEEEGSLVEIEVAEQEEIEVEESETESENNNQKEDIPKTPEKEESPKFNKNGKNNLEMISEIENKNKENSGYVENENEDEDEEEEEEKENTVNKKEVQTIIEENEEDKDKDKDNNSIDKPYSELELKIIDIMNGSEKINNLLNNNNKWDEKKKGLSLLNEFITNPSNKDKIINNFEIVFNYIQDVLKNFKESNFIILKEGLECVCSLFNLIKNNNSKNISNDNFNKKYFNILITELNEKITESKLKNIYLKLIDLLMNIYTPNEIINYLIQIINKSNKISLLKEYGIFIKNYITSNENNIKLLNVKEIIDFCIKIGNNINQQLRTLATDIICLLYNYIGDEYILYIKNNIKESAFKSIEQKLKQTNNNYMNNDNILNTSLNKKKKSIEINLDNNSNCMTSNNSNNMNNILRNSIKSKNRADISKDITPVLLKYINMGKWNEKKEGIEFIHKILNKNNNHVLINGLQDLIELVIEKLTDSNKNLVRLIIELLSHLIESLGTQLKSYTKKIINQLLTNLSDKNNILRQDCVSCINKWISIIQNYEIIFMLIPPLLINDNYDMRNELLNILIENINLIKKENIYLCHFEELINSLLYCLQDKSSAIRNSTEKFIQLSINLISREDYIKKTGQFKPAIAEHLNNVINTIYGFKDLNNFEEILNRERSFSKKRSNKYLSPKKLKSKLIDEENNNIKNEIQVKQRVAQSIGKNILKNTILNFDSKEIKDIKNYKDLTSKNDNKKKKFFPNKTGNETLINITKKNKMNTSFHNALDNFNKTKKKKKKDRKSNLSNINISTNNINNTSINNINNSISINLNYSTFNNNNKNIKNNKNNPHSNIKDKQRINANNNNNNNSNNNNNKNNPVSIPNIAKRVNKFYNNTKKRRGISTVKQRQNKNKDEKKTNILNYKKNVNQLMKDINDDKNNTRIEQRDRFFSPIVIRQSNNSKAKNSFHYDKNNYINNLNASENMFYKRIISSNLPKNESNEQLKSFSNEINNSKNEKEIKGNLFLSNYKIKKEQKEKRIDEDRRNNYHFEIQNFDQIPKIKEIMKNIFYPDFVEKIFGDNITSIISCINKIKKYIEKQNTNNINSENIYKIEDNLDLLLKVIGYNLANNKSSSLIITTFEFIDLLLESYKKNEISLNEIESNILLNIFVDKLVNNSSGIKDTANNLLWAITDIIGEERSLLIIVHLIEYKNIKTKIETINIIIKLYKDLLEKDKYIFDNWKIKIIKNIISLYFEGDYNNKNKLLFIINDLYLCFKNEIWKYCKNISSKNKDELIKRIKESQNNNNKNNFDNESQTSCRKESGSSNRSSINFIFNNKKDEDIQNNNTKSKKEMTKKKSEQYKIKNSNLTKIKSSLVYSKKNKKVFENKKNIKLDNDDISLSHSRQNSNIIENKNDSTFRKDNYENEKNKNMPKFKKSNKNITSHIHTHTNSNIDSNLSSYRNPITTARGNSHKKDLFLKHIKTATNIHEEPNYDNIINQATKKLVLMKNSEEEAEKYNSQKPDKNLSQSTVIINNNYNFIKIKNNEKENKKIERKRPGQKSNNINNINNINNNTNNTNITNNTYNTNNTNNTEDNNSINIIHSNDGIKKKILVNCNKKEKFNEIKKILESLCSGDRTDMTELILKIHNILYTNYKKNEDILVTHSDYIFNKLIQAINNLLNEKKIYTNYIKYISNVLCKICKLGELLSKINLDTQNNLIILTIKTVSLLNDNENDNNFYYNNSNEENSVIIKCFNSIMLRIIDYGDINNNINILMNFEKKYRKTNKEIVSYVAKCLIIIIKNIKNTYKNIDIGIVIENIYNLLEDLEYDNNIIITNKTDQIIVITIKNILSQLIIYRGDEELVEYIINKNISKKNDKKPIFNYDKSEIIKDWLLQYINRLRNHRNKINENNNTEENNINNNYENKEEN